MIIIPEDKLTSSFAAINTSPRIILSSSRGAPDQTHSLMCSHDVYPHVRTCTIWNNSLIGPASYIQAGAEVHASTLGSNCSIGPNSVVRNSYLFDNVVVEANCVIEYSILGAGVRVDAGTVIEKGSLVADKVELGPGSRLLAFERVSRPKTKSKSNILPGDGKKMEVTHVGDEEEEDEEAEEESDSDSEIDEAEESELTNCPLLMQANN